MSERNYNKPENLIHPRDIIAILGRRKWLLIVPLVLAMAVAYGGSYLLTPLYSSSTIIWIDRPKTVSRELMGIIGGGGGERPEEQMQRIRALQHEITSQSYLVQLIQQLNLDQDPELSRKAAQIRSQNQDISLENIKYDLLMEKLRNQISLMSVGADHVRLTVESEDPFDARDKVKTLTLILEQEKARYELEKVLDNQSFADLQLKKTEADYQAAQDSLAEAQYRLTQMQLPESIASETNRRDILSDIDKARQDISDYGEELDTVKEQMGNLSVENPKINFGREVINIRTDIDGQLAQFANMVEKYPWTDQNVVNMNIRVADNIRSLEREIKKAVDQNFSSYPDNQRQLISRYFVIRENVDILNSKAHQLELSLDRMNQRIKAIPTLRAEVEDISRKVDEARRYRDAFRSEEATVEILSQRMTERTRYRIIEPAKVPLAAFYPNRIKIALLGLVLGIVLGGGAVVLFELLDSSFRRVEDVEAACGLKVLATVPRVDQLNTVR